MMLCYKCKRHVKIVTDRSKRSINLEVWLKGSIIFIYKLHFQATSSLFADETAAKVFFKTFKQIFS